MKFFIKSFFSKCNQIRRKLQNWSHLLKKSLTLINPRGGGDFYPPPPLSLWFSLNNSETIKTVTLVFCSIQKHFIRDIHAKFDIPNSLHSPDIGQSSGCGIFEFQISGQSLTKENCHNSRASDDIDMKLRSVTKLDKRNKPASKKMTITSCR